MEAAIGKNEDVINNLAGSLNLEIDANGNIIINPNPNPDNPPLVDVSDKFDKGATTYADAGAMETDIKDNADAIALLENYDDTVLAGRVTQNETDISGIKSEQITQNNSISGNASDISSLSNRCFSFFPGFPI